MRIDNCSEATEGKPTNITTEKWKETNDNVVVALYLAMEDPILSRVAKKSAKTIWDILIKLYEIKSLQNRILWKRRIYI